MKSFPWTSTANGLDEDGFPKYDRVSTAEDLQGIFSHFFSNGVDTSSGGGMQVVVGSGMSVTVKTGWCCINGTFGLLDEEQSIELNASDASNGRIDTIVARWNKNVDARSISIEVVQGTPSANPVRSELTRTASVYELGIADVLVTAGSSSLTQQRITDTRLETTRCGLMTPLFDIDTTSIFDQLKDQVDRNIEIIQSAIDGTTAGQLSARLDAVETEVQPIERGGTGATSASDALDNLGVWDYVSAKGDKAYVKTTAGTSRTRAGSKIVSISSGAGTLFTADQITGILGVPYSILSTVVTVSNGDSTVGKFDIVVQQHSGGVYVLCTKAYSTSPVGGISIRVNYTILDTR